METFELIFEVFDHNPILPNELIGYYSIGLSTMHRNMNHEFYKKWVPLFTQETGVEPQGFLCVSAYIIGPGEKPPAHRKDEDFDMDEEILKNEDFQKMTDY
jgi:hypothetical protein